MVGTCWVTRVVIRSTGVRRKIRNGGEKEAGG